MECAEGCTRVKRALCQACRHSAGACSAMPWGAWRSGGPGHSRCCRSGAMTPSPEQLARQIDLARSERETLLEDLDDAVRELGWLHAELRALERRRLTRWRRLLDWVRA